MLNLKCLNTHSNPIDSTIDSVATKLLTDGIASSYPCTNLDLDPEDQFYVHLFDYGSREYVINDIDLEVFPQLPKAWLEEPLFNLVGWYRQYIDETEIFERKYPDSHLGIPCPKIACTAAQEYYHCAQSSNPQLDNCSLMPVKNEDTTEDYIDYPGIEFEYENSEECMNDIPDLQMVSELESVYEDADLKEESSVARECFQSSLPVRLEDTPSCNESEPNDLGDLTEHYLRSVGDVLVQQVAAVLTCCQPFPGDSTPVDPTYNLNEP